MLIDGEKLMPQTHRYRKKAQLMAQLKAFLFVKEVGFGKKREANREKQIKGSKRPQETAMLNRTVLVTMH